MLKIGAAEDTKGESSRIGLQTKDLLKTEGDDPKHDADEALLDDLALVL